MIVADLRDLSDVMDIMEHCYHGEDYPLWKLQELVMNREHIVLLSDSGVSLVIFFHMYDGKYHMHQASKVGGKDMADLLREAIRYPFEVRKASVVIGFVPERKIRLLIGMNSKIKPTAQVGNGEWLYVITKDNLGEVKR